MKHLSRYILRKRIDKNHNKKITKIREQMLSVVETDGFICTADVWTGDGRRFLGMTASWVNFLFLHRKTKQKACLNELNS